MDDMDLQFDIDVPFETDKKTKKPFPGDFSFNADGLLEDCEIEETPAIPAEEIQTEAEDAFAEYFEADFEDVVEEDAAEEVFLADDDFEEGNFEDEDDAALWDEFRSVFEEDVVSAETVSAAEPTEAEVPVLEEDLESEEEDYDLTLLEEAFRDEPAEEVEVVEETAAEPVEAEVPVLEEDLESEEEDDDLTLLEEAFQDEPAEEVAEKPAKEPMDDVIPVFVTKDVVPEEADLGEDEDEFEFPEDPDTECEFVAVPKPTISVTTWEQVRQRANAAKRNTYETEHFFAVEEDYSENVTGQSGTQTPAEQVMGIVPDASAKEESETEPLQPIWYVDDNDYSDETPMDASEVSDEEMDYDDIFNDDRAAYQKKKKRKNIFKKILKEIGLFFAIIVGALVLVVNFTIFISRQNTVVGHSMEPTLHGGDHVYTTMLPYIFGDPEVGDIVVFNYSCHGEDMGYFHMLQEVLKNNRLTQIFKKPEDLQLDEYWIKRVVAVAGDTVSFKDNQFYRNGELIEEDYILEQTVTNYENDYEIQVPEGQVFVMGDNRNNSSDSRVIGCIDIDIITGKVWKKG